MHADHQEQADSLRKPFLGVGPRRDHGSKGQEIRLAWESHAAERVNDKQRVLKPDAFDQPKIIHYVFDMVPRRWAFMDDFLRNDPWKFGGKVDGSFQSLYRGQVKEASLDFIQQYCDQLSRFRAIYTFWRLDNMSASWLMTFDPRIGNAEAFASDGTFRFVGSGPGAVTADGHWVITKDRLIGLTIEHSGDPAAVGEKLGLGTIRSIDDSQMVLKTTNGDETYRRLP
jgi:hypothetical protein